MHRHGPRFRRLCENMSSWRSHWCDCRLRHKIDWSLSKWTSSPHPFRLLWYFILHLISCREEVTFRLICRTYSDRINKTIMVETVVIMNDAMTITIICTCDVFIWKTIWVWKIYFTSSSFSSKSSLPVWWSNSIKKSYITFRNLILSKNQADWLLFRKIGMLFLLTTQSNC